MFFRIGRGVAVVLAVGIITLAGTQVIRLRAEARTARQVDQQLLDLRYKITDADRAAWQIVAQGFPNFTFSEEIQSDSRQIASDLAYLKTAHTGNAGVQQVTGWVSPLEQNLDLAQKLIAQHRVMRARQEVLVNVDGTAQLIQQTVGDLARSFSDRSMRASDRLFTGTLLALGASALLVGLVAAAFALGRRRVAVAERGALARSERRFRALVQKASEVVVLADAERHVTYVTDAVRPLLGVAPEALVGRPLETVLAEEEQSRALQLFERTLRDGAGSGPTEWSLTAADGRVVHVEVRSTNLLHDPDVQGIVLMVRDVTRRRQMEAELRHRALHDPLTGLANRTLFEDRVARALHRAARNGRSVAVMYLDVDGFKTINDSMGHGAGDELLRTVAGRIDESLRGADGAARLGGDEFACLVEDLEDRGDALAVARRLSAAMARPTTVQERSITVRASIGVAFAPATGIDAEQLIRNADLAMYKTKAEGRGEVAVFEDDLLVAARRRLDLREDLRAAIEHDELTLAYQPLVALDTGAIVGTEALLRWHHSERGQIPPDQFIPIAEDTGLIVPLGRWVLDHALRDLAQWSALAPALGLNINVAPRELSEPDYVAYVTETLHRHHIAPGRLTLEVTENDLLDVGAPLERLEALGRLGVRVAIDDFGTGQSSLARLQRLPVAQVKLDRSFLSAIDEDSQNATLVRSMVELGQSLGLQMVAEGIERDTQLAILRDAARPLGADAPDPLGQGYLFARPQPAAAITTLLEPLAV